jgi:hypothetical protein
MTLISPLLEFTREPGQDEVSQSGQLGHGFVVHLELLFLRRQRLETKVVKLEHKYTLI